MIVPDVAKNWTLLSNQRTITTPRENGVDMNIKEYYPQTTPPPVNIPPLHFCAPHKCLPKQPSAVDNACLPALALQEHCCCCCC